MGYRGAFDSRLIRFSAVLALSATTSACMIPTKVAKLNMDIPRDATPVAIESGLRAMNDPANQQRIEQMVKSPEMKAVERELISGMVDGSLAALSETDRAERIGALTSRYATGMLQGFSRDLAPQIGPAISEMTRSAVQSAMSEAMRPENQAGITTAVTTAMTRDVGPALQKVISDNLAPGIAAALEKDEVKKALGETAHLLGKEIVLGVNEGMTEIQAAKAKGEPSTLGSLGSLVNKGSNIASGITWVLAALVLVLGGVLVKLLMQARKLKAQAEEQKAEARLIDDVTTTSADRPGSREIVAAIESRPRLSKKRLLRHERPSHSGH